MERIIFPASPFLSLDHCFGYSLHLSASSVDFKQLKDFICIENGHLFEPSNWTASALALNKSKTTEHSPTTTTATNTQTKIAAFSRNQSQNEKSNTSKSITLIRPLRRFSHTLFLHLADRFEIIVGCIPKLRLLFVCLFQKLEKLNLRTVKTQCNWIKSNIWNEIT